MSVQNLCRYRQSRRWTVVFNAEFGAVSCDSSNGLSAIRTRAWSRSPWQ